MNLRDELLVLRQKNGLLYAPMVVDWARQHPASELHRHFEWDDKKAAAAYRIDQARTLIQLHVVDIDGDRLTISLVSDRYNGGGYRDRDAVLRNREMRRAALLEALAEVQRWRQRNEHFSELKPIFTAIERITVPPLEGPPAQRRPRREPPGEAAVPAP